MLFIRVRFILADYYCGCGHLVLFIENSLSTDSFSSLPAVPQGNKKGPLGRWDFDTQEEYSEYMNNKEALPKWVHVGRELGCGILVD